MKYQIGIEIIIIILYNISIPIEYSKSLEDRYAYIVHRNGMISLTQTIVILKSTQVFESIYLTKF